MTTELPRTDSPKPRIFSQESWEKISAPEEFDQLIQVVTIKDWLSFAIFGGLVLVGILWSIFGKIPITVTGKGVLIRPRQVVEFQSAIQGNLESLKIRDGDCVKKDEVLATINPSQLKKQLELQQQKLILLQTQAVDTQKLESQRTQLEINGLTTKAESLTQRLQDTQNLTPTLQNNTFRTYAKTPYIAHDNFDELHYSHVRSPNYFYSKTFSFSSQITFILIEGCFNWSVRYFDNNPCLT